MPWLPLFFVGVVVLINMNAKHKLSTHSEPVTIFKQIRPSHGYNPPLPH
jgi:hypothetical protein